MDRFDRPIRIDKLHALVSGRELEVSISHLVVELHVFGFKTAFVFSACMIASSCAGESYFRLDIEKKSQIRAIRMTNEIREFLYEVQRNSSPVTLVCHRRVIIPI